MFSKAQQLWTDKSFTQKDKLLNSVFLVVFLLFVLFLVTNVPFQIQVTTALLAFAILGVKILLAWKDMNDGHQRLMDKVRETKEMEPRLYEKHYKEAGIKIDHEKMIKKDNEIIEAMEEQFKVSNKDND